jgi:hypothetical protein
MRKACLIAVILLAAGCSLLGQVQDMVTFTKCQFRLASIGNTTLAGVSIQDRQSLKELNALDALRLAAALRSGVIALAFTLNVEGRNPNRQTAAMSGMAWILLVDGREVTRGNLDRPVEIAPDGGVAQVPFDIALDLRQVLSGESLDAIRNLAFNVAGQGAHSTRIALKLKPSIMVLGQPMAFPDYVTVSTEFGGSRPTP